MRTGIRFYTRFDNQLSCSSINFNGFSLQIVIKIIFLNLFHDIKMALQDLVVQEHM